MTLDLTNFPKELRKDRALVVWFPIPKKNGDGFSKPPYYLAGGEPPTCYPLSKEAKSKPETFRTWEELYFLNLEQPFRKVDGRTESLQKLGGIGYYFKYESDVVAIDLDHCIRQGKLTKEARDIVEYFQSYTEVSPSGSGLHIFVKVHGLKKTKSKIEFKINEQAVEVFFHSYFVTTSCNIFEGLREVDTIDEAYFLDWLEQYSKELTSTNEEKPSVEPTEESSSLKNVVEDVDLKEALRFLDVSTLTYEEWVKIGMALYNEGYSLKVWDYWSSKDTRPGYYKPEEVRRKWDSFALKDGSEARHDRRSIFSVAYSHGWDYHSPRKEESSPSCESVSVKLPQTEEELLKDEAGATVFEIQDKYLEYSETIPSGWEALDKLLNGGFMSGTLTTLGAPSSMGKTTFILQMARAMRMAGQDIYFFSLEQSKFELISKLASLETFRYYNPDMYASYDKEHKAVKTLRDSSPLSCESWMFMSRQFQDNTSSNKREALKMGLELFKKHMSGGFYIFEGIGDISVEDIKERVSNHIRLTNRTPIVFIDYVQIMEAKNDRATDKQSMDFNIRELRRLARDTHAVVIVISSLNRDSYSQRISLASFKESGSIEYGSDYVLSLGAPAMEEGDTSSTKAKNKENIDKLKGEDVRPIELTLLKARLGRTNWCINYVYHAKYNHFTESGDAYKLVLKTRQEERDEEKTSKKAKRDAKMKALEDDEDE